MTDKSSFPYAMPFDIMVGSWTGHSILYNARGEYLHTGPSLVWIWWRTKGEVMHYLQKDLSDLDHLKKIQHPEREGVEEAILFRDFDLMIDGRSCATPPGTDVRVQGAESSPGTYLFHLEFPQGNYYNNQYFMNPNERHIIGPYVPKGRVDFSAVVKQSFSRISYDVPDDIRQRAP